MRTIDRTGRPVAGGLLVLLLTLAGGVQGAEWYVDNLSGDDAFDGRSAAPLGEGNGPVRSIARALERVAPGDVVVIGNRGEPYYTSISLAGFRQSGAGQLPLRVLGNGAVLSGARRTVPTEWRSLKNGVWVYTPERKGYYQLIAGERALPEVAWDRNAVTPPMPGPGSWSAWRGAIYYQPRPEPFQTPVDLPLEVAYEDVGISLVDVQSVVISDLTIRHFRIDGVHAHDRCTNVILDRVRLVENGRGGLAAGGSSLVGAKDCEIVGNRKFQVYTREKAQMELLNTVLGTERGVPFQMEGGHLLIDGSEVQP